MKIGKPEAGSSEKLGATLQQGGTNFAVYAGYEATRVELCLYENWHGQHIIELERGPEVKAADGFPFGFIWHAFVPGVQEVHYLYRVDGPWDPGQGKRYNAAKALLDPFGRAIDGGIVFNPDLFAFDYIASDEERFWRINKVDNAAYMPRNRVVDNEKLYRLSGASILGGQLGRLIKPENAVVLELHVKGATNDMHELKARGINGTYAGLASPEFIRHLKNWGINTIELMPIHAYHDGGQWGYNSISYFAQHADYAHDKNHPEEEFARMMRTLRDNGIDVVVDVVYNHTAEGDHRGANLFLKGFDNRGLYRLQEGERRKYQNPTGCGNSLNTDHPMNQRMILESLHDLAAKGAAGVRFDLMQTLGRHHDGSFDPNHPLYQKIEKLRERFFISGEGWDMQGYNPFEIPAISWNDKYRDTVSEFAFSGNGGDAGKLFDAMVGYPNTQIFITCHDGLTMNDKVRHFDSLTHLSVDDAERIYQQRMQFALAIEAVSLGVPMITFGHVRQYSLNGKRDGWQEDPTISWEPTDRQRATMESSMRSFAFRAQHPEFHRATKLAFQPYPETDVNDVSIHKMEGQILSYTLSGRPVDDGNGATKIGKDIHIVVNGSHDPAQITLPHRNDDTWWTREVDSSYIYAGQEENLPHWDAKPGDPITIAPRSVLVFTGGRERYLGSELGVVRGDAEQRGQGR